MGAVVDDVLARLLMAFVIYPAVFCCAGPESIFGKFVGVSSTIAHVIETATRYQ